MSLMRYFRKTNIRSLLAILISLRTLAEASGQTASDSTKSVVLDEVVVEAYERSSNLREVPAPMAYIGGRRFNQFASFSIVPALQTMPGVRMEERSPGSYRINIRGSAARAPFGVRNVKVYYNDLPLTNPGGQTYLNQLGFYNFGSLEVIKGPGGSLYGAGTGGVMLIDHLNEDELPGVQLAYTTGSFNHHQGYLSLTAASGNSRSKLDVQHQQSEGFRSHSALRRDVVSWSGKHELGKGSLLRTTFLYGDLLYETPGALTADEDARDPKASRSGSAVFPGAEEARATVHQKTILAGGSYRQNLFSLLESKTVLYGSYTLLDNPTVQNYGKIVEPAFGGRQVFSYATGVGAGRLQLEAGGELQRGITSANVLDNKAGEADTLRQSYEVDNSLALVFMQTSFDWQGWALVAGVSVNQLQVGYESSYPVAMPRRDYSFRNILAPRVAFKKSWKQFVVYASVARGFTPPATEELFPSGGQVNAGLAAEEGISYDLGLRGRKGNLNWDIGLFRFVLEDAIVQRRNAGGGAFYVNAGGVLQHGVETSLNYAILRDGGTISRSNLRLAHTYHHFRYQAFARDTTDYGGNRLPGVPEHSLSAGLEVVVRGGLVGVINWLYMDKLPLNDANTVYADSWQVLGFQLEYRKSFNNHYAARFYGGVENIFDERYSLGNDVNGFGGRYFNAAPGRNLYLGVSLMRGH